MFKEDIMFTVVLIKTSRFAGHFVPISLLTGARWKTADTTGAQAKGVTARTVGSSFSDRPDEQLPPSV